MTIYLMYRFFRYTYRSSFFFANRNCHCSKQIPRYISTNSSCCLQKQMKIDVCVESIYEAYFPHKWDFHANGSECVECSQIYAKTSDLFSFSSTIKINLRKIFRKKIFRRKLYRIFVCISCYFCSDSFDENVIHVQTEQCGGLKTTEVFHTFQKDNILALFLLLSKKYKKNVYNNSL